MNKLIVLGIAFILMFTVNMFSDNSHASLTPVYQWPITITNHQNISTPNPFQQLIKLNIQSLNQQLTASNINSNIIFSGGSGNYNSVPEGTGTFANFEFTYLNGQVIPAWIENNLSGILLIWLKLYSIPANSSIIIYLDIFSSTTNLLSASGTFGIGENPLYSPIYGEYDDGASVFDFYDNFQGYSLNGNNWVYGGSGSIIVNNTVELKTNNYIYIMTKEGFNPETTIADVWCGVATGNTYVSFSMTIGQINVSDGYFWLFNAYDYYGYGSYAKGVSSTGGGFGFNDFNVDSESWQSNSKHVYIEDYGYSSSYYNNQTFNYYSTPPSVYYGIGLVYLSNGFVNVSWFRVRAYPPYGVMPSVYFNPILTVSVSYPSGNSNQTTNNSIIYPQYNATSENLQFNSQYFSFIIDPLFIFSLLTFLSLIFIVFMAIAIVRKRR